MPEFNIHNKETAPEGSRETLEKVETAFGFLPNMMGVLAESPEAVNAYVDLMWGIDKHGTLSPAERQFLMLVISYINGCEYCVPAHSAIAGKSGLSDQEIAAAGSGGAVDNPRLSALGAFAATMIEKRGRISDDEAEAFLEAGFTKAQILEVIVALAAKTISNYTNHIADVTLDAQFKLAK